MSKTNPYRECVVEGGVLLREVREEDDEEEEDKEEPKDEDEKDEEGYSE